MTDSHPHRPRGRRRRRRHFPWLFVLILLTAAGLVFSLIQYGQDVAEAKAQLTEPPSSDTVGLGDTLTLAAAGDVSVSPELLRSATMADGSYDFSQMFLEAIPFLSDADLTVVNLETNIVSDDVDGSAFRAPKSLLTALSQAGVDMVQTANTATIYNGVGGLTSTCAAVEEAGLKPLGTFPSRDAFQQSGGYTLVEMKGFRVAFVAFTKGVGNLNLPEEAAGCVNLLYTDYATTYQDVDEEGIQKVMDNVKKAKPDIIVVLVHWGSEYSTEISRTQKQIRNLLLENGATAILGTHSHLVGQVDDITVPGTLTAYSLGTLLATDDTGSARQSMVLKLEFTRTAEGTVVSDWSYDPIYVATAQETGRPGILDLENAIGRYESGFIGRVSQELYETLVYARERIPQRMEPETEDE